MIHISYICFHDLRVSNKPHKRCCLARVCHVVCQRYPSWRGRTPEQEAKARCLKDFLAAEEQEATW